ncbi:hypothetical protein CKN86_02855 [Carnobacterium divergens]|uniref:restriction endonuclease subunit S n=1 Tax=Carnobacterium divergens TaxID=2748 RepID=UPI000D44BA90|nr:restriction endonuclease subunit S [Carnobacterium divergens]MCO6018986.1 restriction endonuclease subunit S [Carnobacterium divergens]TFI63706.1 hypothetical protein CKN62_02890 [Carnobacterium divergens]TFI90869.1 hypothetical protein CKN84_02890 [Carnobacterium divergens]TFJ05736.1 hypothetical protein CKN86_02855 [Carnobacterium divergens]TFJ07384.1 hypothetical protein CKN65_02895 [Carnobacterium divergens]
MKKNKVPEIRFSGFTDDWELRKLGEYVIIKSGWSPSNFEVTDEMGSLFIKVDDLNYSKRIQSDSILKVNIHPKYKKLKKGSTLFPKRGAAIMTNKVRILGDDGYMDTNMMALEPNGIDSEFLYTFIARTGLYKIADTSTIPQINNKHIEPYEISLPKLKEQIEIGSFFKKLDNTIALHQRELEILKNTKKAFLQKMFPKEGEKVPEVRFPGFMDDWELRKLEYLGKVTTGKAFSSTDFDENGEYLIITNKDISDSSRSQNTVTDRINTYDNKVISKYNLSGENLLVTMDGVNLGKTAKYSNNKALLAQRVGRIQSEQIEFVYQVTANQAFLSTMRTLSVGNAIKHISLKQIADYKSLVPNNKDEQAQIGNFFKKLDNTIALHQRELTILQNTKKAFLQKMFV